ncbi:MAG: DUF1684 domain-containing protein [Chloroflexota bacterium]|nr:DUF1684 domain-containing protein [Dehalococcoidia bacterium]MDW8253610.1 DUF1684 domain-containing protein [Chloroflexota bacterium]
MRVRALSSLFLLAALAAFLLSPIGLLVPTAIWVGAAILLGAIGIGLWLRAPRALPAAPLRDPVRAAEDGEPLEALRAERDRLFRYDPGSPLRPEQRERFAGLRYYPVDPSAVLTVHVEEFADHPAVPLVTNAGQVMEYLRWGEVRFVWQGVACRLTVYRADPDDPTLFVPFADTTNGSETYGGGRYLELLDRGDGSYLLDFNRAYNPYCAYNDEWSCPLPPAENRLPVAIRAGEKRFDLGGAGVE